MTVRPTVVLLHGVGLDHTVWDSVRDALSTYAQVLAPDLPGHGTRPPVPSGVTLAYLAQDVAREIPAGSHLVGFSLGALVAQQIAVSRPDLVASLVSVSSVCRRTESERASVLARLATATTDVAASTAASVHRWYDGTDVDATVIRQTEQTLLANDPDSFVRCYRVFATGDADVGPHLGAIAVPSLAVTGADDPGSTPEMTHRLAEAIPDCSAVVLPDVRHMLPVQAPHELAQLLTAFHERFANG